MKINVGIDLGTTYSAVATFNALKGTVEILKNDFGNNCTPSVVCIEDGVVTIGEEAKNMQASGNPNTAAFYKSMMGDKDYTLFIDDKDYTPEDLSSEYLRVLKKNIEETNQVEIDGAVITVPAYFNEAQRKATMRAGERAGFRVLKIINEPTSAIIAYGLTGSGRKNVMVYDLGGGTFDVTIAEVNGTKVNVLSTNGNHQLGGKNWDDILRSELVRRFFEEHKINIEDDIEAYTELQVECENVKKQLTSLSKTTAVVSCGGKSGRYSISRDFFDEQTEGLLNETILLVQQCFEEIGNGFGWSSLDEVVLVGGSTRMPQVRERIIREYGKPPVTKNVDVDTIVAAGAAMQAQLCVEQKLVLGGVPHPKSGGNNGGLVIRSSDIQDITAHSLGMLALSADETAYINSIIIPKNSKTQETFGKEYSNRRDKLDVYVLQGESNSPDDCTLLYKYVISGMPRGKKNVFTVNFCYNGNGVVEVNAKLENGVLLKAEQCEVTETLSEIIARLQKEREEAKNAMKNMEVMFMLDTSGSMAGDSVCSPIGEAKRTMYDFVSDLADMCHPSIAIFNFAEKSRCMCGFTDSLPALRNAINSLDVDGACGYGTSATPLSWHGQQFAANEAPKMIFVLTDGQWFNPIPEISAASKLKESGVVIYAVGFGDADQEFLEQIASENCARKISLAELGKTFKEISSSIATELS